MGARNKKMFRDGQMRAALDHEAQARVAHQRNAAWKGLHAPAGFARVERYQTADPTLSLATVQDGRPVYDFAAAPSLFVEEDLRQEKHMLEHRRNTCELLKAAEVMEAKTVATRIDSENALEHRLRPRQHPSVRVIAKPLPWKHAVPRTVHSQSVVALRPRATGSQSSPQPSVVVADT